MRKTRLFTIALLAALAVVALWWQLAERRARMEAMRAETFLGQLDAARDSLRAAAPGRAGRSVLLDEDQLEDLRRRGLADPVPALLADLERHPELIPFPGTEGSEMRFYPSQCVVVSPEWVYAYFEDGHVSGRGLFEYRVLAGGRIVWKRLTAKRD